MAKGPARGKFDVYVDGTKRATVDTYAAANTNRLIVWDMSMSAGKHTVRVSTWRLGTVPADQPRRNHHQLVLAHSNRS